MSADDIFYFCKYLFLAWWFGQPLPMGGKVMGKMRSRWQAQVGIMKPVQDHRTLVGQMMSRKIQQADIQLLSLTPRTLNMAAINFPQQSLITLPLKEFSAVTRMTIIWVWKEMLLSFTLRIWGSTWSHQRLPGTQYLSNHKIWARSINPKVSVKLLKWTSRTETGNKNL